MLQAIEVFSQETGADSIIFLFNLRFLRIKKTLASTRTFNIFPKTFDLLWISVAASAAVTVAGPTSPTRIL